MSEWMKRILDSKRSYRAKLAILPFEEKIKLLEMMRSRAHEIAAGKRI